MVEANRDEQPAASAVATKIVGIIYPPPELRNIIDKTAQFVSRNGGEFEEKVRQNEAKNPKFSFLNLGDPYHAYYQMRVRDGGQAPAPGQGQKAQAADARSTAAPVEATKPVEPPPDFDFTVTVPTISAQDISLVKLTALFVARNGQGFLRELMRREARNYHFDFLKPQHSLFTYFTKLVEQYTKVMIPPKGVKEALRMDTLGKSQVLQRIDKRVAWAKLELQRKRKEEVEAERERLEYMSIDWHDFVIVETVPFPEDEDTDLPPPVDPKTLAVRVLEQERLEAMRQLGVQPEPQYEEEEEEEAPEADVDPVEVVEPEGDQEMEVEDVDMDVDMDVESPSQVHEQQFAEPVSAPEPSQVIVKDYDPKKAKKASGQQKYQVCPLCKQSILVGELQEHIRIELLDPRWREQRERAERDRAAGGEAYVGGSAMEDALKMMAPYRTDIFGEVDTGRIGIKAAESGKAGEKKVVWDGYSSSMAATSRLAQAAVTPEERLQALAPSAADRIGPQVPKLRPGGITLTGAPLQPAPHVLGQAMPRPLGVGLMRPPMMPGMPPAMMQFPGGPMMPPYGAPLMHMPPMPQGMGMPPPAPADDDDDDDDEPSAKRARLEHQLIDQTRWAAMHPGPVGLTVQVPKMGAQSEWRLQGQTLATSLAPMARVADLKTFIATHTGLPPARQKLQIGPHFVKDTETLAFYNIPSGSLVQLALKQRGGR